MGIMTALFGQSSPSESELRGAEAWLADTGDGGYMASSGVRVSEANIITLSGVYASARAIAEDVACLPLKAYRRLQGGGKKVASDDPLYAAGDGRMVNIYSLVHDRPNEEMDDLVFRSLLLWWAQLYGNAFAQIIWRDGDPVAMYPVHPHRVHAKRDDDGRLYYQVRNKPNEPDTIIRPREMIHIRGMSDDGIVGLMLSKVAKDAFGIYLATERYTASFFGNGATLSGIITFDQKFKDAESLKEYRRQFNEIYGGSQQAHKWMMADSGAKATILGADPEKSQLVETIKFRIEDVARWFRVPPVIIGHNTSTPYTNVEALGSFYTKFGMKPWAARIEKEFTAKLCAVDSDVFIEHVIDALMWADAKTRAEVQNLRIRGGWGNPNEAREIHNMNPIPGGDRFRIEQNLALLDDEGRPEPVNATAPSGPASQIGNDDSAKVALMPVFVDASERIIDRECMALSKKSGITDEWLTEFYGKHRIYVASAVRAPIEVLARLVCVAVGSLPERFADEHVARSLDEYRAAMNAGKCAACLDRWKIERPAWIAQHLTDEVCK